MANEWHHSLPLDLVSQAGAEGEPALEALITAPRQGTIVFHCSHNPFYSFSTCYGASLFGSRAAKTHCIYMFTM